MKKFGLISMATLMLGISTLNTGCFGQFALVRKVYSWNDSLGNKFVKTIVFYAFNIIPVYGICGVIDFWILNLTEFWSGSNPLAMKTGEKEQQMVMGKDGNSYQITATQNRFDVKQLSGDKKGEITSLVYLPADHSWNMERNGVTSKLARIHEDMNKAEVYAADGSVHLVDLSSVNVQSMLMR
jgi:hypothetical protein